MLADKVLAEFADKRVLVTGGTGLIGRQLVEILHAAGAWIRVVSLDFVDDVGVNNSAPQALFGSCTWQPPKKIMPRLEFERVDLTDFCQCCRTISDDFDFVFHLAGIKGSVEVTKSQPASFLVPLLQINTNVLEACRINNVRKVLYTSSIGAYQSGETFVEDAAGWWEGYKSDAGHYVGVPMDAAPGWAKRMAELQIDAYRRQYGSSNFAVVRPCNVYGPGDNFDPRSAMVIPALMAKIRQQFCARESAVPRGIVEKEACGTQVATAQPENESIPVTGAVQIWGDGSAVRDFAFSHDVAEGCILAALRGTRRSYVNLGSGVGVSIKELVETLHAVVGGFRYEFDTSKDGGFRRRVMNMDRARDWLGYIPSTSLRDGLEITWRWFVETGYKAQGARHNYFAKAQGAVDQSNV